jgi:hypothetical protein
MMHRSPFWQTEDHVVVGSWLVVPRRDGVACGVVASSTVQWLWIVDSLAFEQNGVFWGLG